MAPCRGTRRMSLDEHFGHVCWRGLTCDIATTYAGDDAITIEKAMHRIWLSRLDSAWGISAHRHEQVNITTICAHITTAKRSIPSTRSSDRSREVVLDSLGWAAGRWTYWRAAAPAAAGEESSILRDRRAPNHASRLARPGPAKMSQASSKKSRTSGR